MITKKKIVALLISIILITISSFIYLKVDNEVKEKNRLKELESKKLALQKKIVDINSHFNKYVKTNKEAILYKLENNKYKNSGKLNKNIEFELEDVSIVKKKEYFKLKNLDYYIHYKDVEKIESLNIDHRYRRYVVFNENVTTKEHTVLYNIDGYAYEINEPINLPVIIKEKDKYYVEYNNNLFYIKSSDGFLVKSNNTKEATRKNIRTFTYHAVYKDGEKCKNKVICHSYKQFDSHMKYLSENNYLTLKMEELEMFLDKKINIPIKTVVITLDDGNLARNAIEILEKYKLYATYFIITGRYDSYKIETKYVDFESHTDNLHNNYKCPGGEQGGQLLCEDKDKVLQDLKLSQQKLGGSKYMSYPFFDWNNRAFTLLKQSGFNLAFIGQWNTDGYSDYKTNRYMMRRKTIFSSDSLATFKGYLK